MRYTIDLIRTLRWRRARAILGKWPLLLTALVAACGSSSGTEGSTTSPSPSDTVGHVFVIVLENESYANTFGSGAPASYLAGLADQGALLTQYFGTAHNSQPNYVAMISGQGPNLQMQLDCPSYSSFVGTVPTGADAQAIGSGCVFPASVPSLPDQMEAAGLSWKGYMQDVGNDSARESDCGVPATNALGLDQTQAAEVGDQYAARHNPFVYFQAISTDTPRCDAHITTLQALSTDLGSTDTTPAFSFITPNLCNDGHDASCVDGSTGGLTAANAFLQQWVPQILGSPAFKRDGLLVITFDESDGAQADATACCGEGAGPNALLPGLTGPGGGRIGAVLLSPFITPGTVSNTPYNHYSLLRSVEQIFGLGYLGYAAASSQVGFGADVYSARQPDFPARPAN